MTLRSLVNIYTFLILSLFLLNGCSNGIDAFTESGATSFTLGSGTGTNFQQGTLTLSATQIAANGSVTVSVNIVDQDNDLVTSSVTVAFSSTCEAATLASFSSASVTTTSGTATTTYTNAGCTNTDQITASATNSDGSGVSATGTLAFSATGVVLQIGSGSGASFVGSAITLGSASILTGGNTSVSVNIVDATNALYTSLATVTFSSTCATNSQATFTNPTVVTSSGTATTTYIDQGCTSDFITATLQTGTTNPSATGVLTIVPIRIGSGSGVSYADGILALGTASITAGQSTTVTADIVDGNSALITSPSTVTFASTCSAQGRASFSNSTVITLTGTASTTYTDNGCPGADIITATLDNGTSAPNPNAIGSLTITPLRIGSGTGVGFTNGALTLGLASISASGSTSVSANIVDANANLITTPITVNFTSNCVTQNLASFDVASTSTVNGTANVTYTASGCTGTDTITATATPFTGTNLTATGAVTVAAPTASNIQFTSNSDNIIALRGTGVTSQLPEISTVTFTVVDGVGAPVAGETINFNLNTTVGGITLQSATDISDTNGQVQAVVQSGNVATSVRVTAVIASNTALSTQSASIVISTGLPDQDSISLSATTLNPRAWNHDGVEVTVTARLADRYNNPIQDGTYISFTTELGSIGGSCPTVDGECSVTWRSQAPRGTTLNAGRTTILATVLGEESFIDRNGNGVYDDPDGSTPGTDFTDLEEAFVDYNENGTWQSGEPLTDFNSNGIYDAANGLFDGVQCSHSSLCSPNQTVSVRDSIVLVMSEDTAATPTVSVNGAAFNPMPSNITVTTGTQDSYTFRIVGAVNGQILPAGTTIAFAITNGKITGGANHTVLNTSINVATAITTAEEYTVFITRADNDTTASSGSLTVTLTFPNGGGTQSFAPIVVND